MSEQPAPTLRRPAREQRVIATSEGPVEVITCAASTTGGDARGDGPVLLLLHGMPGDARQVLGLTDRLEGKYPVLAISRPGYGKTPLRSGRGAAAQADLYAATLDTLGISRAVVIGVSGGGPSALQFAMRHPDRCSGIVALCAVVAHLIEGPMSLRIAARIPPLFALGSRLEARKAVGMEDELTPTELAILAADPILREDLAEFMAQRSECLRSTQGLRGDIAMFEAAKRQPPPVWPRGLRMPAEIVHGAVDPIVTPAHARWHSLAIPGAGLTIVDGVGHMVPLTAMRASLDAIERVCASIG